MQAKVLWILILVSGLLGASTSTAQTAAPAGLSVIEGDVVEGRVSRVDPQTRTVTLDNGQAYEVPDALDLNWARVRPGAAVKMRVNVDGGRNIATALLHVRP
jgi:hypothetical protein